MATRKHWLAAAVGIPPAAYIAYAGLAWLRYGSAPKPARDVETDSLLDEFMPEYDVRERHCVRIPAPTPAAFAAACRINLPRSRTIRALFQTREFVLGKGTVAKNAPGLPLIDQAKAWGWGELAETPGREIVFGCVTQPWAASPVFRALRPGEFTSFREGGFVKIAWNIRADPVDSGTSIFRTETRALATDSASRARFRWYWSLASPGIVLIRRIALRLVKVEARNQSAALL